MATPSRPAQECAYCTVQFIWSIPDEDKFFIGCADLAIQARDTGMGGWGRRVTGSGWWVYIVDACSRGGGRGGAAHPRAHLTRMHSRAQKGTPPTLPDYEDLRETPEDLEGRELAIGLDSTGGAGLKEGGDGGGDNTGAIVAGILVPIFVR